MCYPPSPLSHLCALRALHCTECNSLKRGVLPSITVQYVHLYSRKCSVLYRIAVQISLPDAVHRSAIPQKLHYNFYNVKKYNVSRWIALQLIRGNTPSQPCTSATFQEGAASPSVSVIHTHVSYPLLTFARNCTFYILYIMHKMYKTYYIPIHSMAYALCSATLLDSSVPDCTLPAEQCTHGALFQLDLIAVWLQFSLHSCFLSEDLYTLLHCLTLTLGRIKDSCSQHW